MAAPNLMDLRPEDMAREQVELQGKLLAGAEILSGLTDKDIDVGATPKEEVFRRDHAVLYHYLPRVRNGIPVLIVYAFFNRYYMIDLQPNRSLVNNLLDQGLDVYVVDWGYPGRGDRWLTLDDFINGHIDDCVDFLRQRHGTDQVNLLGICQGGVFSLCYTALHPEKVKNLITMVTPVDFHADDGLVGRWIREVDVDSLVDSEGNAPGEFVSIGFLMRSPFQRHLRKYIDMIEILDDRPRLVDFLRMEKWIFDSPDQCGETFRQWVKDFYRDNKLIKGEVEIGGHRVDLGRIRMPVLNIYAEQDDLIPPPAARPLGNYVGTKDYKLLSFPVGHIGMYVSGKVQRDLPPTIANWLKERNPVPSG